MCSYITIWNSTQNWCHLQFILTFWYAIDQNVTQRGTFNKKNIEMATLMEISLRHLNITNRSSDQMKRIRDHL